MMKIGFFLVLSCLLTFVSSQTLQFSHQAPDTLVEVDLLVNGEHVDEFSNLGYGDVSAFVDLSSYSQDEENPGSFNLTLVVSATHTIVDSQTWDLSLDFPSSYFVLNSIGGDEVFPSVVVDQITQPAQYKALWRLADFAPVDTEFQVLINSVSNPLEYLDLSGYASDVAGDYVFSVISENGTVAELFVTLSSGQVATIFFNGNSQYGPTSYTLTPHIDQSYTYSTCRVRVVPAIASEELDDLTVVAIPEGEGAEVTLAHEAEYSEITAYQDLPVGLYTASFTQDDDEEDSDSALELSFNCTDSATLSLIYQGSEAEPSVALELDASQVPSYRTLWLQFVHLVVSADASPATLYLNGEERGTVSFPETTGYLVVESTPLNLSVVNADGVELYGADLEVEFAASYTFYLLGLTDSTEYPLTGALETDLSPDMAPTTTDSTTTTEHDDDDDSDEDEDDDDDGLSGGAIAGIVIGVLLGVAIIVVLIVFVLKKRNGESFSTVG